MSDSAKPVFFLPDKKYYTHLLTLLDYMGLDDLVTITDDREVLDKLDCFYFPFTPYLGHLGNASLLFDDLVWEMVQRPNARLFYDLSCEPITYDGYTSKDFLGFHKQMEEQGIPAEKIVFGIGNYQAIKHYDKWADSLGLKYRIKIVCLNFYFQYYWEVCLSGWFRENYQQMLKNAYRTVSENKMRKKYFMSLNLRPRAHRYAVMLHILERGYFDKGIISFLGEEFGSKDTPSVESIAETFEFLSKLPSGEQLRSVWDELQKKSPIVLDRDAETMRKDLWHRQVGEIDWLVPEIKVQGAVPEFDSYFEIVNDTWFTGSANLLVGEKLVRPLLRLQPFIFVGSPYLLKYMKDVGFKTFSPWIDESYDSIEDPTERMEAILKEIDRLCNMSLQELHKIYCELWPVLEHNFNHFITKTKDICRWELERNVLPYFTPASMPADIDDKVLSEPTSSIPPILVATKKPIPWLYYAKKLKGKFLYVIANPSRWPGIPSAIKRRLLTIAEQRKGYTEEQVKDLEYFAYLQSSGGDKEEIPAKNLAFRKPYAIEIKPYNITKKESKAA